MHARRLACLLLSSALATSCNTPQLGQGRELPPVPPSLRAAFEAMPQPAAGRLRVLSDNVDAWVARWRAIEHAERSVDVQYFIIEPDAFGMSLLGLLYERAKAGVNVRVMVDSRGTPSLTRSRSRYLQELARAGADVRVYNPIETNIADTLASGDLRRLAASNHDKLVLVDRRLAITGGRNISKDYLSDPRDLPGAYIDFDVVAEGESMAKALAEAFTTELKAPRSVRVARDEKEAAQQTLALAADVMRTWLSEPAFTDDELRALADDAKRDEVALVYEGAAVRKLDVIPDDDARAVVRDMTRLLVRLPHLRGALHRPVPTMANDASEVRVLDTHSTEGVDTRNRVNENLLTTVLAAQRDVVIQSPYFVLTERGIKALKMASDRGVKITILTNSPASSDSPPTQAAFLQQWPSLLAQLPTARLFVVGEGRLMHAKVGIVDDELAFVGSYNLDPLSMGVNGEVVSAVWSPTFAATLKPIILDRVAVGAPKIYEYKIERGADGAAVVDDEGQPKIAFGPDDHCDPEVLRKIRRLNVVVKLLAPLI